MAVGSKMERFLRYRKVLARQRHISFSAPWRIFIMGVAALLLYYMWSVLQSKYTGSTIPLGAGSIGDLLFAWFFYGMILGVMLFALLFEGEYLLGVWKVASSVEKQLEADAQRILGGAKKPAKRR